MLRIYFDRCICSDGVCHGHSYRRTLRARVACLFLVGFGRRPASHRAGRLPRAGRRGVDNQHADRVKQLFCGVTSHAVENWGPCATLCTACRDAYCRGGRRDLRGYVVRADIIDCEVNARHITKV